MQGMLKTGYFTHPDCRKHDMGRGHPECPQRLDAIEDRMLASGLLDVVDRREAPLASTEIVELAHDRMHVASIIGLAEELRQQEDAGGSSLV
jgi:acetoin utilization deacetylase AcuC-like enzyme